MVSAYVCVCVWHDHQRQNDIESYWLTKKRPEDPKTRIKRKKRNFLLMILCE